MDNSKVPLSNKIHRSNNIHPSNNTHLSNNNYTHLSNNNTHLSNNFNSNKIFSTEKIDFILYEIILKNELFNNIFLLNQ